MTESSIASAPQYALSYTTRAARYLSARSTPLLLASSIALAAAVLSRRLHQGWFTNDDGAFAHAAERVLQGELPHRDFADLYTGLLSFVNAGIFAIAGSGEDMFYLRIPLFISFLVFVGLFFLLARRMLSPGLSFVASLFAASWSVPVYPAPMPSWYLLFLSTAGICAVVRHFESGRAICLVLRAFAAAWRFR